MYNVPRRNFAFFKCNTKHIIPSFHSTNQMPRIFQKCVPKMCFSSVFTEKLTILHNNSTIFDRNRGKLARFRVKKGQNRVGEKCQKWPTKQHGGE